MNESFLKTTTRNYITTITFSNSKGNSLCSKLLTDLSSEIEKAGQDEKTYVIVLKSGGDKIFCAGASFEELKTIDNFEDGKEFLWKFGKLLLAIKNCPKFVITKVQGAAVGGGVGLAAVSDYVIAESSARIKLSELNLGLGAFVINPVLVRKIGKSAYTAMSIDCQWRDAGWAETKGLFNAVYDGDVTVENAVYELAEDLTQHSPMAMKKLKEIFWNDAPDLEKVLEEGSSICGELILSDFTKNFIQNLSE